MLGKYLFSLLWKLKSKSLKCGLEFESLSEKGRVRIESTKIVLYFLQYITQPIKSVLHSEIYY